MLEKSLQAVSLILEPFLVGFLTLVVVITATEVSFNQKMLWIFTSAFLVGVPPFLTLVYEKKTGKIADWFIYKREERRDVELAWVVGALLLTLLVYFLHGPILLFALSLNLFFIGLTFMIINFYWKISVHTAFVSLFVLTLVIFKSVVFLPSIFLIFLVGYSRWYLHKHSLTQLTVGSVLTLAISYLVFSFLGLISL